MQKIKTKRSNRAKHGTKPTGFHKDPKYGLKLAAKMKGITVDQFKELGRTANVIHKAKLEAEAKETKNETTTENT